MAVAGYAQGIQTSFLATMNARAVAARHDPIQTVSITPAASAGSQTAQASSSGSSFVDEVLDVINPLQHLPVVSTVYRAITGDKIGDVAQVAGDTLYGGIVGFGASVANLLFKDATGKNFGDTVLAFVEGLGSDSTTAVADAQGAPTNASGATAPKPAAAPPAPLAIADATPAPQPTPAAALQPAPAAPASVVPAQATMLTDPAGFMAALKAKGIDPTLGMRAMQAYEKTLGITQP